MKRFLLSLVALVVTSVCFAQDTNNGKDIVTRETATQFSNDKALLDMYNSRNKKVVTPEMQYKRGKRMKVAAYAVGGTLLATGLISTIIGVSTNKYNDEYLSAYNNSISHSKYYNDDRNTYFYIGGAATFAGLAVGVPLYLKGNSLQKKYGPQVQAVSTISQDINLNNGSSINLGIDMLSSNVSYAKTPGIGIRYNF